MIHVNVNVGFWFYEHSGVQEFRMNVDIKCSALWFILNCDIFLHSKPSARYI
jgi:hypothetical protein